MMLYRLYGGATLYTPSPFADAYWKWLAIFAGVCASVVMGAFLFYEFWALAHGHPENTLSAQVWVWLKVTPEPIGQWSAVRFLALIAWITTWVFVDLIVIWLTGHFFWMTWR